MEKKNKIIIVALVILIIALAIGIASVVMNGGLQKDASVPEGMKKFDFNSEFTMAVPKNAKFLKEWNKTNLFTSDDGYSYFDKTHKFSVSYVDSPLLTHELVNTAIDVDNKSGNATYKVEGDLIISHSLKHDGKVGKSLDKSNFTELIVIQKGHKAVVIMGNDLDYIRSMADTVEFYE